MELSTFMYLCGGIAVAGYGAYYFYKNNVLPSNYKDAFIKSKSQFNPLLDDLSKGTFKLDTWTAKVVSVNDRILTEWWEKFVNANRGLNSQDMITALRSVFSEWGIHIEKCKDNRPPKLAFVEDIDQYLPLLKKLQLGEFTPSEWTTAIVNQYNTNIVDLWTEIYKQNGSNLTKLLSDWKIELESFGVRIDESKSFIYHEGKNSPYITLGNFTLVDGAKYKIIKPAVVLTKEDFDGNVRKSVLLYGEIAPYENENS